MAGTNKRRCLMSQSDAAAWASDAPTPGQLSEFFQQIKSGRIAQDNFQEFLRTGGAPPSVSVMDIALGRAIQPEVVSSLLALRGIPCSYDSREIEAYRYNLARLLRSDNVLAKCDILPAPPEGFAWGDFIRKILLHQVGSFTASKHILELLHQEKVRYGWFFPTIVDLLSFQSSATWEDFSKRSIGARIRMPGLGEAMWILAILHDFFKTYCPGLPLRPYAVRTFWTGAKSNTHLCVRPEPLGMLIIEEHDDEESSHDLLRLGIME